MPTAEAVRCLTIETTDDSGVIKSESLSAQRIFGFSALSDLIEHTDDQAAKGFWRMPWRQKAMKDVVSCDKLRGAANKLRSGDFRMGKPDWSHVQ